MFGLGLSREYALHELYNLRASGFFGAGIGFSSSLAQYGMSGGTVALDTRFGDTYRFGINLGVREAVELAEDLKPYFQHDVHKSLQLRRPVNSERLF